MCSPEVNVVSQLFLWHVLIAHLLNYAFGHLHPTISRSRTAAAAPGSYSPRCHWLRGSRFHCRRLFSRALLPVGFHVPSSLAIPHTHTHTHTHTHPEPVPRRCLYLLCLFNLNGGEDSFVDSFPSLQFGLYPNECLSRLNIYFLIKARENRDTS